MNKEETKKILNQIFNYIEQDTNKNNNSLIEAHPCLYFFHSKEELDMQIEQFLETKKEFNKYDIYYFVKKMIKFLLISYDSHTTVKIRKGREKIFPIIFPISFKIIDDKVYIINIINSQKDNKFGEIIKINDIDINQIINEIKEMTCYSTKEFLYSKIENSLNDGDILKSLPSINTDTKIFKYTIKKDGKINEITFNCEEKYEELKDQLKDNYTINIKNNIIILTYNLCENKEKMLETVKELEHISIENNINNFIIDLRGNIGGDSTIIKPLIEFLKNKNVVTLIDKEVFSSGRFACLDLKNIGSYFIGTNIATTLNACGYVNDSLDLNDIGLKVYKSIKYFVFKNNECIALDKNTFSDYFKNKEEFFNTNPGYFEPNQYVEFTLDDYINNHDPQLESAINYMIQKQL